MLCWLRNTKYAIVYFNNNGSRPVYHAVFEGDEISCHSQEKARALLGYFSVSPKTTMVKIEPDGTGSVTLLLNNQRVQIQVDGFSKRIIISKVTETGELVNSNYNYEFYLRNTIDNLIINATELIMKMADMDTSDNYKLWNNK